MVRVRLSTVASDPTNPLGGRGGYFAYDSAVKKYPIIEGLGKRAIEKFMDDATRELRRIRGAM